LLLEDLTHEEVEGSLSRGKVLELFKLVEGILGGFREEVERGGRREGAAK
jgi:hypothetical protein